RHGRGRRRRAVGRGTRSGGAGAGRGPGRLDAGAAAEPPRGGVAASVPRGGAGGRQRTAAAGAGAAWRRGGRRRRKGRPAGGAPWKRADGGTWHAVLELRREIDPRTETVLTVALLAGAFAEVGDAAEAERVLRQAVTARPQEVVLLVALGRLLERQGPTRFTEAIGDYRAAPSPRPLLGIALGRGLP